MTRKTCFFAALGAFLALASVLPAETVTISPDDAVRGPWLGYGINWLSPDYTASNPSASDWTGIYVHRLSWMRPGVARVLMSVNYMLNPDKSYNFSTPRMVQLYRVLDYCQAHHVAVILTEWGNGWIQPRGWKLGDADYIAAIGAYAHHLVTTKNYSCIKYFALGNEPDLDNTNFEGGISAWADAVSRVRAKFDSLGLKGLAIVGPDATGFNPSWVRTSALSYSSMLGGYDVHDYVDSRSLSSGRFEAHYGDAIWSPVEHNDAESAGKVFLIGEAGMADGSIPPATQTNIGTYDYGVWMADYGIQAARAGTGGIACWMLDDDGVSGMTWGLWSSRATGYALRPWFYTWSLLSRYVPPGAVIYAPANPFLSMRVLGAKTTTGAWTFIAVNEGSESVPLTFIAPTDKEQAFQYYLYSGSSRHTEGSGLPAPLSTIRAVPSSGITETVPPNAVVFLTSVDADASK